MPEETALEQKNPMRRKRWSKKAKKAVRLSHALRKYWANLTPEQRRAVVANRLKGNGHGNGHAMKAPTPKVIRNQFAHGACMTCLAVVYGIPREKIEDVIRRGV